jgi:hypothetical protein
VVVALRTPDGGVGLANALEPLGVSVLAAADAEQAARRLTRREAVNTVALRRQVAAAAIDKGGWPF